jgi:hypothetical protein
LLAVTVNVAGTLLTPPEESTMLKETFAPTLSVPTAQLKL